MDSTVIFESPGKFLKGKSSTTTPYFYAERAGLDSVAFILVDENREDKYGVVKERKPALDDRYGLEVLVETAFGGSNDAIDDEKYREISKSYGRNKDSKDFVLSHFQKLVQTEAREESGFDVDLSRITYVSKELVSTQMNQWVYTFAVNVTGLTQGTPEPQNAEEEQSTIVWKTLKQVQQMNDWKAKTIVFSML